MLLKIINLTLPDPKKLKIFILTVLCGASKGLMKALTLANPAKWSNTLKQFVGNFPTNCLSVFDHFVKLGLKGLKAFIKPSGTRQRNAKIKI